MTTNDIKTLISSDEPRTLELKKTIGELKESYYCCPVNIFVEKSKD